MGSRTTADRAAPRLESRRRPSHSSTTGQATADTALVGMADIPCGPVADPSDIDGGLVRLVVDLTPSAYRAFQRAVADSGDSRTDTVNRALLIYAHIQRMGIQGRGRLTFRTRQGGLKLVRISNG